MPSKAKSCVPAPVLQSPIPQSLIQYSKEANNAPAQDFHGQRLAELLSTVLLILSGVCHLSETYNPCPSLTFPGINEAVVGAGASAIANPIPPLSRNRLSVSSSGISTRISILRYGSGWAGRCLRRWLLCRRGRFIIGILRRGLGVRRGGLGGRGLWLMGLMLLDALGEKVVGLC